MVQRREGKRSLSGLRASHAHTLFPCAADSSLRASLCSLRRQTPGEEGRKEVPPPSSFLNKPGADIGRRSPGLSTHFSLGVGRLRFLTSQRGWASLLRAAPRAPPARSAGEQERTDAPAGGSGLMFAGCGGRISLPIKTTEASKRN